ncbi:hypothetical protein WA026_003255 [Henosepilachna vigintioctopunctata]|uniref:Uncharacterized protein n=1 Tax=Henosepilachna vigintioctopunctata TaxID=420089 RepID=A0AAW1THB4_9CUCU
MRIVSGTLKSTPIHWLPVLSHIPPPDLRRKTALLREYENSRQSITAYTLRGSRRPPMRTAKELEALEFDSVHFREREWRDACPAHCRDLPCITEKPPAYKQPRKIWTSINRISTGHGVGIHSTSGEKHHLKHVIAVRLIKQFITSLQSARKEPTTAISTTS